MQICTQINRTRYLRDYATRETQDTLYTIQDIYIRKCACKFVVVVHIVVAFLCHLARLASRICTSNVRVRVRVYAFMCQLQLSMVNGDITHMCTSYYRSLQCEQIRICIVPSAHIRHIRVCV